MEKNLTTKGLFEALLRGETITEKKGNYLFKSQWRLQGEDIVCVVVGVNSKLLDIPLANLMIQTRTININGFEVPEPCRKPLEVGTTYYHFGVFSLDKTINSCTWVDDSLYRNLLAFGFVHLTEEAAIQHAKALLSFTEGK